MDPIITVRRPALTPEEQKARIAELQAALAAFAIAHAARQKEGEKCRRF